MEQSFIRSKFSSKKTKSFLKNYEELLMPFVGKNITLVEFGVLNGGSLFMFKDYLGEKSRIIGIDLNTDALKFRELGFEIFIADQSNMISLVSTLKQIGKIDILIDDGGHRYIHNINTLIASIDFMNDKGIIITEDTITSYWKGFGFKRFSYIRFVFKLIDVLNSEKVNPIFKKIISIRIFHSMVVFYISHARIDHYSIVNNPNFYKGPNLDYRFGSQRILRNKFLRKLLDKTGSYKDKIFVPIYNNFLTSVIAAKLSIIEFPSLLRNFLLLNKNDRE